MATDANGNIDLYNIGTTPESLRTAIRALRLDFDSHIHDGGSSKAFQTLTAETMGARAMTIRKSSFADTLAGMWMGLVGDTMKLSLGNATNYLQWDGSSITIVGAISGGSLNINNNAVIDSSGNATFIGISSLNKKAFTNFETAARFTAAVIGTGSNSFGNQGVTIAPGATATSSSVLLWNIGNVFTNYPTFTCTINVLGLVAASGTARAFIGMGQPSVNGSGITYSGNSQIGFRIDKDSGTVSVSSEVNDGGSGTSQGAVLTTIADGDIIELFIKVSSANVKWYYRKNGGSITLGDTQTTHIPAGTGESSVMFATSNAGTAFNYQLILQCAAYEH